MSHKNNIIYYIYNYYLPLYPLKNRLFSGRYDLGKLAVWRVIFAHKSVLKCESVIVRYVKIV